MGATDSGKGSQAVDRALGLLVSLVQSRGTLSLAQTARDLGLATSTAHRLAARLEAHGLLMRTGRGRYRGGATLARCAAHVDPRDVLIAAARPFLRQLARATARTAHLGVLEDGMVTYLVREAPSAAGVFTRESMQLEAYCSAIGKVLLAGLSEPARTSYIGEGVFVPLTPRTIVAPALLREQLARVAASGHAFDDEEVEEGLFCVAVPLALPAGLPPAAISLAGAVPGDRERAATLAALRTCGDAVARKLDGSAAADRTPRG